MLGVLLALSRGILCGLLVNVGEDNSLRSGFSKR
jgi:hypothetical protein